MIDKKISIARIDLSTALFHDFLMPFILHWWLIYSPSTDGPSYSLVTVPLPSPYPPPLPPTMQTDTAEVKDPYPELRKAAYKDCPKQASLYEACVKRITESKTGDCEAWYVELVTCVDAQIAPKIFKLTKE